MLKLKKHLLSRLKTVVLFVVVVFHGNHEFFMNRKEIDLNLMHPCCNKSIYLFFKKSYRYSPDINCVLQCLLLQYL